jgi:hypothetical protein
MVKHRVNVKAKLAAAQLAQERADALAYVATVQASVNLEALVAQAGTSRP